MWLEIVSIIIVSAAVKSALQAGRKTLKDRNGVEVRPFHAIPGPGGIPVIGSLVEMARGGAIGQFHTWLVDRAERYGPIMKEKIFGTEMVLVSGVELIEELAKHEAKYPTTFQLEHVKDYKRRHGIPLGITTR